MNKGLLFIATLLLGYTCANGKAYAETLSMPKSVSFYAGVSAGVEKMSGRRSESLDEQNIAFLGPRLQSIYTNNLRMSERNVVVSGMTGFLWKVPNAPLVIGPEIYVGRGNTSSALRISPKDPFVGLGATRLYTADIQRRLFYGILMRVGYPFWDKYLAYLSLGFDRSQFSITRTLHTDLNIPATLIKRTQDLNGTLFGIGLERQFNSFIVGLDVRMIRYSRYSSLDNIGFITDGLPNPQPAFLSFSVRPQITMASLRIAYRF